MRSAGTQAEKDKIKTQLPSFTPSALFKKGERRRKGSEFEHTGFLCVDIDAKHNPEISNFAELKTELAKVVNVAAVFTSASGNGFFALIPLAYPEKHREHFDAIEKYFTLRGITIDPACKDVTRLRFATFDPAPYLNPKAVPVYETIEEVKRPAKRDGEASADNVFARYNTTDHFIEVLEKHGWSIDSVKGTKTYFTRPGKDSGVSAEFDSREGVFYVFTSSAEPFKEHKGYNPFQIFCLLEHDGDTAKAARYLEQIDGPENDFKEPI
ncbi:MAG: hypothetical protein HYZ15_13060 [Sphingobacteriales bacterium]|nr:hypothetical protein [Sphingobacteriales bacterium]